MSLSRRGFLGVLLASVGTLAIDPGKLLWTPAPAELGLPELVSAELLTLKQITGEICKGVGAQVQGRLVDANLIGLGGMTNQFAVTMMPPGNIDPYGLNRERYVKPVIESLVSKLKLAKANAFGVMRHPVGAGAEFLTVTDPDTGVSVRAVLQYQIETDLDTLRFDVLCGKAA